LGEATGHETIFLHKHLDDVAPSLRSRLMELAKQADLKAGWGMTDEANLTARCLEVIRYMGSHGKRRDNIGWHADGATLMTMVVMISKSSDYEGGSIELKDSTGQSSYDLAAGDVIAWRGWTLHRVTPILRGARLAFVVEWWQGQECAESLEARGPDTADGVLQALKFDPSSPNLHRYLGEQVCEQLPCATEAREMVAEDAYRQAVLLSPRDATSVHSLGNFLVGSDSRLKRAEGISKLREAHALDPSVAGPVPAELEMWRDAWKAAAIALVVGLLFLLIRYLERLDSSRTKKPVRQKKDD